ncbi:MAG TPA: hypothetical protein VGG08_02115, partial [Solirubrobacteraceae bacterium]
MSVPGATAFMALPSASAGVSGDGPANADLVGGSTSAGHVLEPWAIYRQLEAGGAKDQVYVRSFAGGAWTARGGALNFDPSEDAEEPSLDFAGPGRTEPWASWYEQTTGTGFNAANVFASSFEVAQDKWVFAGQSRGAGVPSLNIEIDEQAEDPSLAGGSTSEPANPKPWVAWQEEADAAGKTDQVFVARSLGPDEPNCDGVTPAGVADGSGHVPAIGGWCWQQVGVPRTGSTTHEPSLDVDPTRNAQEPQIAFAGESDETPWVVWSESGTSTAGLRSTGMVFAAHAAGDGLSEDGDFHAGAHAARREPSAQAALAFDFVLGACASRPGGRVEGA